MPHVVLSGQTSVRSISALHAKHFISAPGPPVADTLMKPTLRPSEVAPYRCGPLLGRGSEPSPLQGPVIWPTSNQGHIALPPRGSKRLGPQYGGRLVRLAASGAR